jgi:hypothetical protein
VNTRRAAWAVSVVCLIACAGESDALRRGQRYYEDNQYERALALWRDLDRRDVQLSPEERVRFAYFRGMTDYRLGFREDARHWLSIAKAESTRYPGGLDPRWLERLDGALADLRLTALAASQSNGDVVQTIEITPSTAPSSEPPAAETIPEPASPPQR